MLCVEVPPHKIPNGVTGRGNRLPRARVSVAAGTGKQLFLLARRKTRALQPLLTCPQLDDQQPTRRRQRFRVRRKFLCEKAQQSLSALTRRVPLKSAAHGARDVATWLKSEGFDVACLTDGPGKKVTSNEVSTAITGFATKPPTYDILVVYFSGHGQWHTRADHWLLAGAPQNTAEAINLEGAMYTARKCGIPNVVFISDACRTIPKTDVDNLVNGVDGFPNHAIPSISKIDFFKATSESRSAYEIPISGSDQSVLTRAILSAFEHPEPQIVKQISDGVQVVSVVPNRLLESVLQPRVDAILDGVDGNPIQTLDMNVPSSDNIYLARVSAKAPSGPS